MGQFYLELDWTSMLLGEEKWTFLFEATLRSVVMFVVIILSLRVLGKRGVKQLSVFELGVIIGLGSAAGDPMFYKDVGLLSGMVVFIIVMSLYKLITFLINRSDRFETFLEGKATTIIEEGQLVVKNFKKEPIARDEMFSQLRLNSISHLGQVQQAIIETNGEISVYFMVDEKVRYGLPILPNMEDRWTTSIPFLGMYACTYCGNTKEIAPVEETRCDCCENKKWIAASNSVRVR
jgi:uncharacterized membrane protein YcaP (DUF421 family)